MEITIDEIYELKEELGIPKSFCDAGITDEDYKSNFNLLLEHSMLGATRVNPVTVSIDDMKQMLDAVYYGRKIDF